MTRGQAEEPVFNAPWPALVLALSIPALYFVQSRFASSDLLVMTYGLVAGDLLAGRWVGLFTSLLLHGGWGHALVNAGFALAFGPPVARLFGSGFKGVAAFFLFYVACGVLSGLSYVLLHPHSPAQLIGASGAISGLLGAAVRLLNRRRILGPLFSRQVFSVSVLWFVGNLLMGVSGLTPGADGMPVAWEAHVAGYVAGLILIGPFAALFGRRAPPAEETEPVVDAPN